MLICYDYSALCVSNEVSIRNSPDKSRYPPIPTELQVTGTQALQPLDRLKLYYKHETSIWMKNYRNESMSRNHEERHKEKKKTKTEG